MRRTRPFVEPESRAIIRSVTGKFFSVWCQVDGDLIWNQEYTGSRPVALTIIKLFQGIANRRISYTGATGKERVLK